MRKKEKTTFIVKIFTHPAITFKQSHAEIISIFIYNSSDVEEFLGFSVTHHYSELFSDLLRHASFANDSA